MIIHISGASGSGKTILGKKIKKEFGNDIIVKDLDNLREEFMNKLQNLKSNLLFDENKYQRFINRYIEKNKKKSIVFVGLNDNVWGKTKNMYYELKADYKYYIDIDEKIITQQKCKRFIKETLPKKVDENKKDISNKNLEFIENITEEIKENCSLIETIKLNKKLKNDYKKMNYSFMTRTSIFNDIFEILKSK